MKDSGVRCRCTLASPLKQCAWQMVQQQHHYSQLLLARRSRQASLPGRCPVQSRYQATLMTNRGLLQSRLRPRGSANAGLTAGWCPAPVTAGLGSAFEDLKRMVDGKITFDPGSSPLKPAGDLNPHKTTLPCCHQMPLVYIKNRCLVCACICPQSHTKYPRDTAGAWTRPAD